MRAEVGLLTRNIVVMGEMEDQCYPYTSHICDFFDFDTFGGHIKFALGFKAAHLEGVELKYMGQQLVGQYPIHFHLAGDLDEKGGYDPPTYIRDLSIHHTFSRCVTVHGSNGLLVSACWKGILSRDLGCVGEILCCAFSPTFGVNLAR
ncbi:cell migration-inducing and hyaluronan-binding protein-like [Cricetulus griseus]|uniref:cell migration-inducing and hyaluronan-binding protein-like n=1 Tax=Cricetulus griseus TaxID=10029 RepID=UPI000F73B90D|nr:cell migration-inducing and hyaluronan-binding protein-like [Cricetulus griseus]